MPSSIRAPRRVTVRTVAFTAAAAISSLALANSGVQLRLDNYQAGSESTSAAAITNANFESASGNIPTGWTPDSAPMVSGVPDPGNLPNPASVVGTRSAQAAQTGGISPFSDYFMVQDVTLQPNTDYVISGYMWNYATPGAAPHNDLFAGDLAVLQVRDTQNFFNTAGVILEPVALDNQSGSRGYFVYKTFNSSQFSSTTVTLELSFDPNQDLQFGVNRPELSAQWDNVALTPLDTFAAQRFTNPAGGSWTDAANWQNGVVNAKSAVAGFHANNAGNALVTQTGTITLCVVNFAAAGGYTIGGGGTLVFDHEERDDDVIVNNLNGNNTISNPIIVGVGTIGTLGGGTVNLVPRQMRAHVQQPGGVLALTGGIAAGSVGTLGTGTFDLIKTGPGRLDTRAFAARELKIDDGTVRMTPGNSAGDRISVATLTIAGAGTPTARLDITNQAFVINYTDASPLATVYAQIQAGFAGGSWSGNGIATSQGAGFAVGYAEASELAVVPGIFGATDATTLLLRGTLAGDANLDGIVNIGDFSILGSNYNTPGNWAKADFNYDGNVGIADFSALAANFNRSVTSDAARGAAVPEPAAGALVGGAAMFLLRRRKGR